MEVPPSSMRIISLNMYCPVYAYFARIKSQHLFHVVQQKSDDVTVQLYIGLLGQIGAYAGDAPGLLVGTGGNQGVDNISNSNQPGMGVNLTAPQAPITAA